MCDVKRNEVDPGSPGLVRTLDGVDPSGGGRFRRQVDAPRVGDRHGQLVVTGYLLGDGGGVRELVVQCDCGRPEHRVSENNFRNKKIVRCNACAKSAANETRQKFYLHYAGACPNLAQRRRLLNRISAAHTRCYSPNAKQYASYGGRGIRIYWKEIHGDEPMGVEGRGRVLKTRKWRYEMLAYVVALPGSGDPSLELDRIDNDAGYSPGNLRFVSRQKNSLNKRQVDVLSARVRQLEAELESLRPGKRRPAESIYDIFK